MITNKVEIIENYDDASELIISSSPQFDFSSNPTSVKIYKLEDNGQMFVGEYTSTNQIFLKNQKIPASFSVPLAKGKFKIEISILVKSEGVENIFITKS